MGNILNVQLVTQKNPYGCILDSTLATHKKAIWTYFVSDIRLPNRISFEYSLWCIVRYGHILTSLFFFFFFFTFFFSFSFFLFLFVLFVCCCCFFCLLFLFGWLGFFVLLGVDIRITFSYTL